MTEKIIYQFNGETYETREEAERAVYYYAEDTYDEVLDMGDDVIICGLSYSPSIALKRVDEIAYRCGFNDSAYFAKVFRKFKNSTPKKYRANIHNQL